MNRRNEAAGVLQVGLSEETTHDLCTRFAGLPDPARDTELALAGLVQTATVLPIQALRELLAFRGDPRAPAALLVTGLPIDDDLPPTPVGSRPGPAKPGCFSDLSILFVAVLLGDPIAYRAEKDGVLVQNVFPTEARKDTPSNESSSAPLGFHTELTFSRAAPERPLHVTAPDFVLLLGLRCPEDRLATTAFVEATDVCALLSDDQLLLLREPQYQLMAPYSFTRDGDGTRPWSVPVPLLRGPAQLPSLAFDSACGTRALSPAAQAALDALIEACEDAAVQRAVELRQGHLLALNNRHCAHARSSFVAEFDGRDRWLQRVYVRRGVWPATPASDQSFRVLA